ncbi:MULTISPECIES: acyltransferase [unclassified Methylobacterium]|uniref:acyltransferase family protein n=1 Tax=unclassified Methylobacterium TaxID=2615210 RepID=UPI00226A7FC0|nr:MULTISPECIES: acyltransferase [unclassified Methylobacterium]
MKTHDGRAALDLVRGIAALLIVVYHYGRWFAIPLALNSSLAVDLFFCLSGYVMMTAYSCRLTSDMSRVEFFSARLIRLMPLAILGTLMSASYAASLLYMKGGSASLQDIATSALVGALNLPNFFSNLNRGDDQVFPLNGPQYSLFFEMVVNIAWAYWSWTRKCIPAILLSILCFCFVINLGVLGGDTSTNFLAGFPRVGASFFYGVVLFHVERRLDRSMSLRPVFLVSGLISFLLFCFPFALPFKIEIAWVAVGSPVLILSGSRTNLSGRLGQLALYLGKISYPVYILHYPVFCWVNGAFQSVAGRQDFVLEALLLMIAILLTSHLAAKVQDRSWRFSKSKALPC